MSFVFSVSAAKIANVPLSCFAPEGPTDNSKKKFIYCFTRF